MFTFLIHLHLDGKKTTGGEMYTWDGLSLFVYSSSSCTRSGEKGFMFHLSKNQQKKRRLRTTMARDLFNYLFVCVLLCFCVRRERGNLLHSICLDFAPLFNQCECVFVSVRCEWVTYKIISFQPLLAFYTNSLVRHNIINGTWCVIFFFFLICFVCFLTKCCSRFVFVNLK